MREQNEKGIGYFRGERDAFRAAIEHPFRRVESESPELEDSATLWFHGKRAAPDGTRQTSVRSRGRVPMVAFLNLRVLYIALPCPYNRHPSSGLVWPRSEERRVGKE